MSGPTQQTRIVRVRRWTVTEAFYAGLREMVIDLEPGLIPGVPHKVQDILGDDFWDPLDRYTRIVIGACVAQMVRRGEVPLVFEKCECQVPKRYCAKRM